MSDELQALCFMAGANSIFYGEKLLTTGNPDTAHDRRLFERLNIVAEPVSDAQGAAAGGVMPVPLAEPAECHSATA
jgi:biotin synthase